MKPGIIWIFLGIVIIMGAIAFTLSHGMEQPPAETACTLEAKTCPDGTIVGREGPQCEFAACPTPEAKKATFSWRFESVPESESETGEFPAPQSRVFLTFNNGEELHMGTYEGTCMAISDSSWTLLEHEQDAAICWWGGGGTEIGIFLEGDYFVVKRGLLEEGAAEASGLRGDFASIYTLR